MLHTKVIWKVVTQNMRNLLGGGENAKSCLGEGHKGQKILVRVNVMATSVNFLLGHHKQSRRAGRTGLGLERLQQALKLKGEVS